VITTPSRTAAAREIGKHLRGLRTKRGFSQTALAERLGLSQSRLSAIERGARSLTAEEFLDVLRLFNVPASLFVSAPDRRSSELQNALARLGAAHLRENPSVLATDDGGAPRDIIREVLVEADSPRLITALAPVLVIHVDHINFRQLRSELATRGLKPRLGWLVENTLAAAARELAGPMPLPTRWARLYGRAVVVLDRQPLLARTNRPLPQDVLDKDVRSDRTKQQLIASASAISRRWNIVTGIQIEDFVDALRASRVGD
jgi:transcriptional regulator with XRE-family HTH domain